MRLSLPEREFYDALKLRSQDVFEGFIKAGTASKSWFAIFSMLSRLRMACDHIALTVKSHIDEEDWNATATKSVNHGGGTTAASKNAVASNNDALGDDVSYSC